MAEIFSDIKPKILGFTLTLDGKKPTHDKRRPFKNGSGTYDRIIRSIKLLAQNDYFTEIRINVDKENLKYILPAVKEVSKIKTNDKISIMLSRIEDAVNPNYSPVPLAELYELICELKTHISLPINCNIPIFRLISMLENPSNHTFPAVSDYCNKHNMWVIDIDGKVYSCNEAMGEQQFLQGVIENPSYFVTGGEADMSLRFKYQVQQ